MKGDGTPATASREVRLMLDTCDCGADYPCEHGQFVYALVLSEPHPHEAARAAEEGREPREWAYSYSEVAEFPAWLVARIVNAEAMVALLRRIAPSTPEARRLLDLLDRDPIEVENERVAEAFMAHEAAEERA